MKLRPERQRSQALPQPRAALKQEVSYDFQINYKPHSITVTFLSKGDLDQVTKRAQNEKTDDSQTLGGSANSLGPFELLILNLCGLVKPFSASNQSCRILKGENTLKGVYRPTC